MSTFCRALLLIGLLSIETFLLTGCPGVNLPPIAVIKIVSIDGLRVEFDGTDSYDPDGEIVGYNWDFGDGVTCPPDCSASLGTEGNPTHSYSSDGTYEVELIVTDDDGAVGTDLVTVTVHLCPCLPGWSYHKPVTIDNTGNPNDLTDYQVKVMVDHVSGKMNSDFSDLRFGDLAGNSLSYWIESYTADTEAKVWVKVPSIPASGTATICMYYGNPGASSESDGDATFDIFEDFDVDDGEWMEYDPNDKIELDYTTDHRLEFNHWIRTDPGFVYKLYSTQNFVEEYEISVTDYGGNANTVGPGFSDTLGGRPQWQNGVDNSFYAGFWGPRMFISARADGNWVCGPGNPTGDPWEDQQHYSIGISLNTTYYARFKKFGDSLSFSIFSDPERTTHISGSPKTIIADFSDNLTFNYYYLMVGPNTPPDGNWEWTDGWTDNYKVRKYTEPEPTTSVG